MREIKFRAWNISKKEMYKPTYEAHAGRLSDLMISLSGDLMEHNMEGITHQSAFKDKFELMQYTGLKDKNGKEIYEGDIIQFDFGDDSKAGVINTEVVYEGGMFCYDSYKSRQVKKGSKWTQEHDYCNSRWWGPNKHPLREGYYGKGDCKQYGNSKLIEVIGNIHENPELLKD